MRPDRLLALRLCAALSLALCVFFGSPNASSQELAPWQAWDDQAERARTAVDAGSATREELSQLRTVLEAQRDRARKISSEAGEDIGRLEGELAALGPAPEEGVAEAPDAAKLRKELNTALAEARALQGRADRARTRAENLLTDLAALGQQRFLERLSNLGPSPVNPANWVDAADAMQTVGGSVASEVDGMLMAPSTREMVASRAPLAIFALITALFVAFGLRGAALGFLMRGVDSQAGRGKRLALGVGATAARFITLVIASGLLLYGLGSLGIFGPLGDELLRGVARALVYLVFGYAIAAALFSPNAAGLRPAGVDDAMAQKAFRATMLAAAALGLDSLLFRLGEASDVSTEAQSVFTFIPVAICAFALYRLARVLHPVVNEAVDTGEAPLSAQSARLLRRAVTAVAIVAPILSLIGYEFAARFILFPSARSLGAIAIAYLIFVVVREAVEIYLGESKQGGERLRLIPILVGFLLFCALLPFIALIWGAEWADLRDAYDRLTNGFVIGDVALSPIDFVTFALVFGIGYTLTRMAQRVLKGSVLPKTGMGSGGADALTSGVGYVGVFIAALAAISATGIDLSNLAIVAGALSVGIGFGLQNIVNNFVSGVILLVERPIKVGDWIDVGGAQGYVKKVNVRSTEIETFDRASYILPNSDLISGAVLNWTHADKLGRVIVPVGVAYGTDPRLVEKLLLEVAAEHAMVVSSPAPVAFFMNFGADALEFELRAHLRDVNWMLTVKSDLNFKIAERFAEAEIEIPFAQRDLHIKNPEAFAAAIRRGSEER